RLESGVADGWAIPASLEGTRHWVGKTGPMARGPAGTLHTDAAMIGLTYPFDVLRPFPCAELQIGMIQLGGAVLTPQTLLAMELGVGGDYFVTRRFTAGLAFHYLFQPADLLSDPLNLGTNPFSFTATARASWIF